MRKIGNNKRFTDEQKKMFKECGINTVEQAIEKWNEMNRAIYYAFNYTTLPIPLAKQLVAYLKHINIDLKVVRDEYDKTVMTVIETLERQLKQK